MKTVAIIGATGVVGSQLSPLLLAHPEVGKVIALGRRELADPAAALPVGVDIAISCLGTTMKKAGSKEAFRAVDRHMVVAFARAALQKGAERFLLVSSAGANARSLGFYTKVKGEAEDELATLGYRHLAILRPWFIDDEGKRPEHRLGERIVLPLNRALTPLLGKQSRYVPISAETIARALLRLAFDDFTAPVRKLENDELHRLGALTSQPPRSL